jgi:D-alanyl-lipoteichoic acid acyltransferase DltB (MBOAT superfamily)
MLFNSVPFLIFFPIVVGIYFIVPHRARWMWLLIASYYFYMQWEPKYALLIVAATSLDYLATMMMRKKPDKKDRLPWLWVSITGNCGMLFFFKYYNWFNDNLIALTGKELLPFQHLLLPVGISFYTFQSLSYSIDVYRGKVEAEQHPGIFATFVVYWPQLVAGPIDRAKSLIPQIRADHKFDYRMAVDGMILMAWGMFKKTCVADRLAPYTKSIFQGDPESFTGTSLLLGTILFCVQVYCDFSGYSDIALGSAQVMGVRLVENFRRPFFSKNIEELWRRWHMSLVGWFNEYIYQPLAYSARRASMFRKQLNVLIVFLITGLWHGASWKFVAWGGLNGLFVIGHVVSLPLRRKAIATLGLEKVPRLHAAVSMLFTFTLFSLGSVFFSAKDFTAAVKIFARMPFDWGDVARTKAWMMLDGSTNLLLAILGIGILLIGDVMQEKTGGVRKWLAVRPAWVRWPLYFGLVLWIVLFGVFEREEFVYFQF